MKWKTVRCVVEVPVLGDYTEKDLSHVVERCMKQMLMPAHDVRLMPTHTRPQFGRVRVKGYGRHIGAKRLALWSRKTPRSSGHISYSSLDD